MDNRVGKMKSKTTGRVTNYEKLAHDNDQREFDEATGFFGDTDEVAVEEDASVNRSMRDDGVKPCKRRKHARRK